MFESETLNPKRGFGIGSLLYYYDQGKPQRFPNAAISTEQKICSEMGKGILIKGGNALDAAITGALCVGVINSFSSGIGGGGFMVIRNTEGKAVHIDYREIAPQAASRDMYKDNPLGSIAGGLAVAVPGEIRGFGEAHKLYGKLDWKTLLEPVIELARNGFKVPEELGKRLEAHSEFILSDKGLSETFSRDGKVFVKGEIVKRENLAKTLHKIAEEGSDAFYSGEIADSLIDSINKNGGIMTKSDFADYKVQISDAIETYYRGYRILTSGTPTSGHMLVQTLNILEGFDLPKEKKSSLNVHRFVESLKHGFASRTILGDTNFIKITEKLAQFMSKSYASELRDKISNSQTFDPKYYNPQYDDNQDHGTTHVSVVDANGMAVSLMSTVNLSFGAQFMDPVTGIILNNEMDDFSTPQRQNAFGLKPSPNNFIVGKKRPQSSSSPLIIEKDGKVELVIGGSGGSRIITACLQIVIEVLDYGKTITEAVEQGRIHHQLFPNSVRCESTVEKSVIEALQSRGHEIEMLPEGKWESAIQAIKREGNEYEAVSDPRKHGQAAGY